MIVNVSYVAGQISSFGLSSIPHQFRSASHSVPYLYLWQSMIGHTDHDGSVLNDDLECPGSSSHTPGPAAPRPSPSQSAPPAGPDEFGPDRTRVLEVFPNREGGRGSKGMLGG